MNYQKIFKIVLISFIAIIIRSVLQLIIPSVEQTVLQQSIFVKNGTLPVVFMLYGTMAFTGITFIFLLLHSGMSGGKISKGIKTGVVYSILWTVFLWEPLPHGSAMDMITYPLADSAVLLLLGLMTGKFLSEDTVVKPAKKKRQLTANSIFNISLITLVFAAGRMIEYNVFHIYSMFEQAQGRTLLWVIGAGIIIGLMYEYLNDAIRSSNAFTRSLIFGGFIFGVNLFFFNFFLPLVLQVDILDLTVRTLIDTAAVFIGCLLINIRESKAAVAANYSEERYP